jgi:hypothetical protein
MKMGIFFGNLFWGILLILWGVSLILRGFGVNIPLAKVFFAIVIILFGIKLLVGGSFKCTTGKVYKESKGQFTEYSTVFATQKIDLTHLKPGDKPVKVNVVFASGKVILPDDVIFDSKLTTVFGSLNTPTRSYSGIADTEQVINPGAEGDKVFMELNTVFGRTEVVLEQVERLEEEAPADSTAHEDQVF